MAINWGNLGSAMQQAGNKMNTVLHQAANTYSGLANMGSGMANAVSQAAQNNQFAFNSGEAALQRQYNEEMWDKQTEFNSAQAQLNREFQAQEAQTNRDWQERMANTAYQRQIADLKAAGLNPVLAAFNGGAAVGSGAQASGSQASAGLQSGAAASGSNYSGQGNNMSAELAMFGMIGSMIGEGVSALGTYLAENQHETQSRVDNIIESVNDYLNNNEGFHPFGLSYNGLTGFFNNANANHFAYYTDGHSGGGGHHSFKK